MSLRSIQLNDLARMANTADAQLAGRGTADQTLVDEFNFRQQHGMSRQDIAKRAAQRVREAADAEVLKAYEGDAPASIRVGTRGMKPARAALAGMVAWKAETAGELAGLVTARDKLNAAIDEPAAVEAKRSGLLRDQACRLLDFVTGRDSESTGFDSVQRRALDSEIDSAQHRADVAHIALADIEKQIAAKEQQLARLDERLPAYVSDAVLEHADSLGAEYLEKIAGVRAVVEQLVGMCQLLDLPYPETIELPTFRLASLKNSERSRTISVERADKPWRELIASWGVTPRPRPSWVTD